MSAIRTSSFYLLLSLLSYGLFQAAAFGVPQVRRRFFLVAALRGVPLPKLPQATHAGATTLLELPTGFRNDINPKRHFEVGINPAAPHPMVTLADALDDLVRPAHRLDTENCLLMPCLALHSAASDTRTQTHSQATPCSRTRPRRSDLEKNSDGEARPSTRLHHVPPPRYSIDPASEVSQLLTRRCAETVSQGDDVDGRQLAGVYSKDVIEAVADSLCV